MEDPFRAGIDERFIYLDEDQQNGFDRLLRSVQARRGLTLVTGPAGSGKTTLVRKLVSELPASDLPLLFCASSVLALEGLLGGCREQAGLAIEDNAGVSAPMSAFRKLLAEGEPELSPVLLIDEAQSLSDEMLRDLLELAQPGADGKSLLPIILAGNCSFVPRLKKLRLREKAQSVGFHYELPPLRKPGVAELIRHRLAVSGCADSNPFSHEAIEHIADYAQGVRGTVNTLCRLALFFASDKGEGLVTVESVELAASAALIGKEPLRISRLGPPRHSQPKASDYTDGVAKSGRGVRSRLVSVGNGLRRLLSKSLTSWSRVLSRCSSALRKQAHSLQSAWRPVLSLITEPSKRRRFFSAIGFVSGANQDGAGLPSDSSKQPAATRGSCEPGFAIALTNKDPVWVRLRPAARFRAIAAISVLLGIAVLIPSLPELRQGNFLFKSAGLTPEDARQEARPLEPDDRQLRAELQPEEAGARSVATVAPYLDTSAAKVSESRSEPISGDAIPSEATAAEDPEIIRLLALAEEHIRADRLTAPRFNNALSVYRKVLRASPGSQEALNGLAAIKAKLMFYAKSEVERGDAEGARRQLEKIRSIEKEWGTAVNSAYEVNRELDELTRQADRPVYLSDR